MALFLLICTDKPDASELRAATREAHLAYLASLGAQVKLGGPTLDAADGGGPIGSLLIVEVQDIGRARALADADPYAQAGLFAAVEVKPWRLAVGGFA